MHRQSAAQCRSLLNLVCLLARSTPEILAAADLVLEDPKAGTPPAWLQAVKESGSKVEAWLVGECCLAPCRLAIPQSQVHDGIHATTPDQWVCLP